MNSDSLESPAGRNGAYKSELHSLSPVAVKRGQTEVHAPDHDTWGLVKCDLCEDAFLLGPNRIHGARITEQTALKQLESLLAQDHNRGHAHRNAYELHD